MDIRKMTLEEMVNIWEDRREIQNLMGRYTYSLLLKQEKDIFDIFWCKTAPEPSLGFNHGYYAGYEAIRNYYQIRHERNLLRTKLIMEDFADRLEGKTSEEMYGCGVLDEKPLCNQIIEIAKDRKTAKGFWYVVGLEDEYSKYGPVSCWTFGMYGVDFIMEENEWKIWHLTYVEDIHTPCGESWTEKPVERPVMELYRPMEELPLPDPTVKTTIREYYSTERSFTPTIRLPEEYNTFAETFSYGSEGGAAC